MDDDERCEFLGLGPERYKGFIGQFTCAHVGEHFRPLEALLAHGAFKLHSSLVPVLHWHATERDKTIRRARHELGDSVVDNSGGLNADLERHRVVALWRRGHDELLVDAHVVEVAQALAQAILKSAQAGVAINLLLLVDRVRLGI